MQFQPCFHILVTKLVQVLDRRWLRRPNNAGKRHELGRRYVRLLRAKIEAAREGHHGYGVFVDRRHEVGQTPVQHFHFLVVLARPIQWHTGDDIGCRREKRHDDFGGRSECTHAAASDDGPLPGCVIFQPREEALRHFETRLGNGDFQAAGLEHGVVDGTIADDRLQGFENETSRVFDPDGVVVNFARPRFELVSHRRQVASEHHARRGEGPTRAPRYPYIWIAGDSMVLQAFAGTEMVRQEPARS
mmetsp:Transcript_57735/g.160974  ORF Transcript_57735/g.160974 Transcript_57735/m.160974 type:complete len:246 (-) Transcript_57735:585-1322(-)